MWFYCSFAASFSLASWYCFHLIIKMKLPVFQAVHLEPIQCNLLHIVWDWYFCVLMCICIIHVSVSISVCCCHLPVPYSYEYLATICLPPMCSLVSDYLFPLGQRSFDTDYREKWACAHGISVPRSSHWDSCLFSFFASSSFPYFHVLTYGVISCTSLTKSPDCSGEGKRLSTFGKGRAVDCLLQS